jgi:molecular chaperone HscB
VNVERAKVISKKCWKCKEPVGGPVCSSCGAIQPPPARVDYYTMLGLPRSYFLELPVMERSYRLISRKVHPDRFVRRPAVERRMSLQWTATLNEARRVLRDPIRRARYLATGRADALEEGGPVMDPDFLERIFELQMEAASDPASVASEAESLRAAEWSGIESMLRAWESSGASLDGIEAGLARLKYLDNIVSLADTSS